MRLELEIRTLKEDSPVELGAETENSNIDSLDIILKSIKDAIICNPDFTSFVAKVYF